MGRYPALICVEEEGENGNTGSGGLDNRIRHRRKHLAEKIWQMFLYSIGKWLLVQPCSDVSVRQDARFLKLLYAERLPVAGFLYGMKSYESNDS